MMFKKLSFYLIVVLLTYEHDDVDAKLWVSSKKEQEVDPRHEPRHGPRRPLPGLDVS